MSYRRPFAQREIVKPYLDKLKENISFLDTYDDIEVEDEFGNTNRTKYVDFYEVMETIDDLLSGEEAMTREEAISFFKDMNECTYGNSEAVEMAIKALEQEPCKDCISRQAVLGQINCWIGSGEYRFTNATDYLIERVKHISSVTPQPKTGRWIEHFDESGKWYECDQCHTDWGGPVNYCPNCGKKMEGDK